MESEIGNSIWATAIVIATLYCGGSFVWNRNPNGELLAFIWMAAFFGPFTVALIGVVAAMLLMAAVPIILRWLVQHIKKALWG
jgi:1,4-dihydroxy-2-naphthoate octaprenyltransferase